MVDIAYAAAMRFWAYPILIILMIAALRSQPYAVRPPGGALA
jgi:PDZ domain-containing secreted protein